MKINRDALHAFYDIRQKDKGLGTHVSPITAFVGEDLILGLLRHCLEGKGYKCHEPKYSCTTGKSRGPRLDAWLPVLTPTGKKVIFQTEIKNWGANAIGGIPVAKDANEEDVLKIAKQNFRRCFYDKKVKKKVLKVLCNMEPCEKYEKFRIVPLVAVWNVLADKGAASVLPLFNINNIFRNRNRFPKIWVFSASAYLRSLDDNYIQIEMPRVDERLNVFCYLMQFKPSAVPNKKAKSKSSRRKGKLIRSSVVS